MQVGDLVRRKDTIDPRIGLIEEAWKANEDGKVMTRVLWHTGQVGIYFTEYLEAICK